MPGTWRSNPVNQKSGHQPRRKSRLTVMQTEVELMLPHMHSARCTGLFRKYDARIVRRQLHTVPHWSVKWTRSHSQPFAKHSCGFLATCLTCMVITATPDNPTVVSTVPQNNSIISLLLSKPIAVFWFCFVLICFLFFFNIMDHMTLTGIKGKHFPLELD